MTKVSQLAERLLDGGDGVEGDELAALLGNVRRIADGVGAIQELAVAIVQRPDRPAPMVRLQLTRDDVETMRRIDHLAAQSGMAAVSIPASWLRALLRVVDDPTWVS